MRRAGPKQTAVGPPWPTGVHAIPLPWCADQKRPGCGLDQDRRDLWRAPYLILRDRHDTSEAILEVVPTDGYQLNDELVFLFGERGGDSVGAAGEQWPRRGGC